MIHWSLAFHHPTSSLSIEACERLMEASVGGPVTVALGEPWGNPRDGYDRAVAITAHQGELRADLRASQGLRGLGDPDPIISRVSITFERGAATFATKLAAWRALQAAFAAIGWQEHTLDAGAAWFVDDAEAAGDEATAQALRRGITAALVAQARVARAVAIYSPRTDIEPVLRAYQDPERIVSVILADCRLQALPHGLTRFPNIETLDLQEDAFDGSVLRGLALPRLAQLRLSGRSLRRVAKEDLAGFPELEVLILTDSSLEALDPEIVDVCPRLRRVYVQNTPLRDDRPAFEALRARWPRMAWSYHDGIPEPPPVPVAPPIWVAPPPPPPVVQTPIDPALAPFFEAILAAPDDDAPRLALATFLTARGDARGEQIALACELAKLELDDPRRPALANRCQAMTQFAFFSGTRYEFVRNARPRRGFIESIECTIPQFVANAELLMRDAPIRGYTPFDFPRVDGDGGLLAACPALAALQALGLQYVAPADRAAILASPYLTTLQTLTVQLELASASEVEAFAAELRPLGGLRRVVLMGSLSQPAVASLIALVAERALELDVQGCTLKPTDLLETLWRELGERVWPRRLPRVSFEQGVLDLYEARFRLEQIRALIATGDYRGAVELRLGATTIGDAFAAFLATSGALPALVELAIGGARISDVGAHALAADAVGLDALATIHLGEVPKADDAARGGVSDAAVEELARSPRLPALRTITREVTHRAYAAGAREETETFEIRRGDGQIVTSKLFHGIWP